MNKAGFFSRRYLLGQFGPLGPNYVRNTNLVGQTQTRYELVRYDVSTRVKYESIEKGYNCSEL